MDVEMIECCRHPPASRAFAAQTGGPSGARQPDLFRHGRCGPSQAPLPGERGRGVGVRCHLFRTVSPLPFAPEPSLTLGCAQALSRRERDAMRHVCEKSPYQRSPNPFPFDSLTLSAPNLPALVPTSPILPRFRRGGGRRGLASSGRRDAEKRGPGSGLPAQGRRRPGSDRDDWMSGMRGIRIRSGDRVARTARPSGALR